MTVVKKRILMIDDDVEFASSVQEYFLAESGFEFTIKYDGLSGAQLAICEKFDVIILDVTMPQMNGFDTLKKIRQHNQTPIIMLTARGDDFDRILGLESGADDYVPKPCHLRELIARVKAILRRTETDNASPMANSSSITVEDLTINTSAQSVVIRKQRIAVTGAEFLVLAKLVKHAGKVVSKDDIARFALGRRVVAYDRSVDAHIVNLRKKMGPRDDGLQRIKTVRGRGYLLVRN